MSVIMLLGKITCRCFGALTQHVSMFNRIFTQIVTELKKSQENWGRWREEWMKDMGRRAGRMSVQRGKRGEEEMQ